MNPNPTVQLSQLLDHSTPEGVLPEVQRLFGYFYRPEAFAPVAGAFDLIIKLFRGEFAGYMACNTEYHDLGHTMDAFVATARLIDGRSLARSPLAEESAVSLLIAALIHDTGYIQEEGDTGTGAKYTQNHVDRSIAFLERNADRFGFRRQQTDLISLFIACTGLKVNASTLCFESEEQVYCGAILGTADLLGQMADRKYLEKLLFLYYEFREAGIEGFNTEFDILKNTLSFYESTRKRLDHALLGAYTYAEDHFVARYGATSNLYIDAIERQMEYLRGIIRDDSSNFRRKLKRINLEEAIPSLQKQQRESA